MTDPGHPGLEVLYRELKTELTQFALKRLGDPAEAEDVVQEAFVRFQKQPDFHQIENPRPYLYTTVTRIVIDRARERKRRSGQFDENKDGTVKQDEEIDPLTPEVYAGDREDLMRVLEAVTELPEKARMAFLLHRVRNQSYAEVATHMGLSVKTVENHMTRALKLLHKALENGSEKPGKNND